MYDMELEPIHLEKYAPRKALGLVRGSYGPEQRVGEMHAAMEAITGVLSQYGIELESRERDGFTAVKEYLGFPDEIWERHHHLYQFSDEDGDPRDVLFTSKDGSITGAIAYGGAYDLTSAHMDARIEFKGTADPAMRGELEGVLRELDYGDARPVREWVGSGQ